MLHYVWRNEYRYIELNWTVIAEKGTAQKSTIRFCSKWYKDGGLEVVRDICANLIPSFSLLEGDWSVNIYILLGNIESM